MQKQLSLFVVAVALFYLTHGAPVPEPVNEIWKELPCLGKVAGQRLPHPKNPHQFLRCVTADSVWIETCPDNLFYNPHLNVCDWDTNEKTTTPVVPDVIKARPVLVKFRPVDEAAGTKAVEPQVVPEAGEQSGLANQLEVLTTPESPTRTTIAPLVAIEITEPITTTVTTTTIAPLVAVEITEPVAATTTTTSTTTTTIAPLVAVEIAEPVATTFASAIASTSTTTTTTLPVVDVTPEATFEVPESVINQQVHQDVPVTTNAAVEVLNTQDTVSTTPVAQFVVPESTSTVAMSAESETTTLPVVEMSTSLPLRF